jgi:hypothetical protein
MDGATLFKLLDATGGGACQLADDGSISQVSPRFSSLVGTAEPNGKVPGDLLAELPSLDQVAGSVDADTPVFRQLGSDGVVRELAPALVRVGNETWLILVDRSSEARLKRRHARLGRQIDDLRAELEAHEREPLRSRVRPMRELAARLDESLHRSRRYKFDVTVLRVSVEEGEDDRGKELLSCVRTVDDVGGLGNGTYAILLPHTDLPGGKIVADRIASRLGGGQLGVGVAQAQGDETGSALVSRAEQACRQALERGGGVLLAVDVL